MRKANDIAYLPFRKRDGSSLKVIDGNPLVVRGSTGGNQPLLTLIWGKSVSEKTAKRERQANRVLGHEDPGVGLLAWCNANQGVLTAIGLVAAACFFVGSFSSSWYMKSGLEKELREHVDTSLKEVIAPIREEVRKTREDVIKLQADLANLQGRLGGLADIVYKEKAFALGIKEPQIVPIQLSEPSATAPPVIQVSGIFSDETTFQLEFKIEGVTQDSIKFLVNGVVRAATFVDGHITLPRKVGVPFELNNIIAIPGLPKILLTILDFPMKDTAIVAVGEKSSS